MIKCGNRLEAKSGGHIVMYICHNEEHPAYKRIVKPWTCNECSEIMRTGIPPETLKKGSGTPPVIDPDGTLTYSSMGWEPPPCPPGYRRKSDDLESQDAWVLEPTEPLCKYIKLVLGRGTSCRCRRVIPTCVYEGKSSKTDSQTCPQCDHKESKNAQTSQND